MLNLSTPTWDSLISSDFTLQEVKGFPFDKYRENLTKYETAERWFTGEELSKVVDGENGKVEVYPLRINPLIGTCTKHGYMLFGEAEHDGRPLVRPKFIPANEAQKKLAQEAE